ASLAGSSLARLGSLVQEVFSWSFFCLPDPFERLSMDICLLFHRFLGDGFLTELKHLKHSQSLDHVVKLLFGPAVADAAAGGEHFQRIIFFSGLGADLSGAGRRSEEPECIF